MKHITQTTSLFLLFAATVAFGQPELQEHLSKLQVENVLSGWGEVGIDRSVSGNELRIGGKSFSKGLGVHAPSYIKLQLNGTTSRFKAAVGIDDYMRGKGSVEFVVIADGQILWRSGIMKGGQTAKNVDIPLTGVQSMELRVTDGGNGNGQDHANWANPVLTFSLIPPSIVPLKEIPNTRIPPQPKPVSPNNRSEARASLIPYPVEVEWLSKDVNLTDYKVIAPPDDSPEIGKVVKALHKVLLTNGSKLNTRSGRSIFLKLDPNIENSEAYHLNVTENKIEIFASSHAGLFYGVQTLRQLIQPDTLSAPCCRISDQPAFKWRGFMHDLGRNPQDVELLKKFIDVMAQYKMNIFHMHLTDYPGYRIECKKYPELNDPKNQRQTRRPGFFYSYAELNDLINYCKERNIMVVPEIDMPGHSEYFKTAFGTDMQSAKGQKILSDMLEEFFNNVDLPYLHMGSDEVRMKNKNFMPEMKALIEARGKDVIVWRPGHLPDRNVITQMWTGGARPIPGVRYIDSQANYINHMDALVGPIRAFMQQPCRVQKGTDTALGGILCHWPDNNVGDQMNIYKQSPVFPALLAYSERIWRGSQNNRADCWAKLPATDDPVFTEYAEFESDMLIHRDRYFKEWPFRYVTQTDIPWKLIGPFNHQGDVSRSFPVETKIQNIYQIDNKVYKWQPETSIGGTIHLNHFFGFEGHINKAREGTVYGLTYIYSPKKQEVGMWIGFNERSSSGRRHCPNPKLGEWSVVNSKVWVNDEEIAPPKWQTPELAGGKASHEVPYTDENYFYRKPTQVTLEKGWNKILVKAPHAKQAWKWMFTCIPVASNGNNIKEAKGLKYSTEPIKTTKKL